MVFTIEQFNQQLPQLTGFIRANTKNLRSLTQHSSHLTATYSSTTLRQTIETQVLILYNINYATPILHFRVNSLRPTNSINEPDTDKGQDRINEDMVESMTSVTSLSQIQLLIPIRPEFQLSLKDVPNHGIWWFVHPCDTDQLLQGSLDDEFLINWFSVFGNWLL